MNIHRLLFHTSSLLFHTSSSPPVFDVFAYDIGEIGDLCFQFSLPGKDLFDAVADQEHEVGIGDLIFIADLRTTAPEQRVGTAAAGE